MRIIVPVEGLALISGRQRLESMLICSSANFPNGGSSHEVPVDKETVLVCLVAVRVYLLRKQPESCGRQGHCCSLLVAVPVYPWRS